VVPVESTTATVALFDLHIHGVVMLFCFKDDID
jgi:hypothetical protein